MEGSVVGSKRLTWKIGLKMFVVVVVVLVKLQECCRRSTGRGWTELV